MNEFINKSNQLPLPTGVRLLCLLLLAACSPADLPDRDDAACSVSFTLPQDAATRATTALPVDSTIRVIAYLRTDGQTGYPDANRRDECTYKMGSDGTLSLCAVNADGMVDTTGIMPKDMALPPGTYDFYAITPALRVYHEVANPTVAVKHGVDFASSFTRKTVTAGANTITLTALSRQCARLKFRTDRQPTLPDLTKIRVQSLTLEEMTDEPVWAVGTDTLALTNNTYTTNLKIPGSAFSVPAGNTDYQQTATTYCLPRPARDFRLRASVLYNADTTPTVLETTVRGTAFATGSSNTLNIYFGYKKIKVEVKDSWTDNWGTDNFGVIDLNTPFNGRTANCYIVTDNAATNYSFDASVRGNGIESTSDPNISGIDYSHLPLFNTASVARVIWQTGTDASTLVIDPATVKLINGKVFFTTSGKVNEGNAVIGIFASSADNEPCIWSWHIWKLDGSAPDLILCSKVSAATGGTTNFYMMDRNLGAYNNIQGDVGSMGFFYQWGRKDPFPGITGFWGTELTNIYGRWNNGGTTGNWSGQYSIQTTPSGTGSTESWAVQYPTVFITNGTSTGDWLSTKNDHLWGTPWTWSGTGDYNGNDGTKSIYDPCPVGYRVPPGDTWSKQTGIGPFTQYFFIILNSVSIDLWFPFSGLRLHTNGMLDSASWFVSCWSSSAFDGSSNTASALWCDGYGNVTSRAQSERARGYSIRCVKEIN